MEHLRCVVERITYQNADNGYTVLKCAVKNYSDLVTVVGTMPDTHVGSVLSLEGMWKMDAKYGRQFLVEKFLQLRGGDGHGECGYCFLDGRKLRLGGCIVGDEVGKICFRA